MNIPLPGCFPELVARAACRYTCPMFSAPENSEFSHSWSVSEVNAYLKGIFEADANLQDLWVAGEISNLSRPSSGHLYFTLKDQSSSLRCVMWKNRAQLITASLQDGTAVEAHGTLSVYEQRGEYQLYVDFLRPRGEGALFQEFLRLKTQLEGEGLFDPARKRPIPPWPKRIGIVTSPSGAAFQDMKDTLQRRYPLVKILLSPTSVQGEAAPREIIAALKDLYQQEPDLILVGRGGGSIEDLWAFNDEMVARTIAASPVPVISGVGHETDFTISDFVADLRAPTPTAAAELAVPDQADLRLGVGVFRNRLARSVQSVLADQHWKMENIGGQISGLSPLGDINNGRQRLDELIAREERSMIGILKSARDQILSYQARLSTLNPEAILKRGYAVVTASDGSTVYQVGQTSAGKELQVRVSDGLFEVIVQ
ncbi:MAG: exodeoxyribonuclease VII large subunit [Chloroflexi bacterium]|nr:exodeoxyribonuclease VII large subunit [Chloroflexota bacterium]